MEKKTKNLLKALLITTVMATTISLVTTLSVGEKEKTYICETDRLLDGYTAQTTANTYPNGVTIEQIEYPSYSVGLEYSTLKSSGEEGTKANPYKASVARGKCTATDVQLPEYYYDGQYYYKVIGIDPDGFNAKKPVKNESGSEIGCYDLTSISSLKELSLVGSQAFAYTSLTTVQFSNKLMQFSPSTFFHCKKLETTEFIRTDEESISKTGTYSRIESVGNNCFADCVKYTGMMLPTTLSTIGNGAYQNCVSLTSVFLPKGCEQSQELHVGDYAFAGCTKVTVIYFSTKVKSVGKHAFEGCINAKGYSALTYAALLDQLEQGGSASDWNYLFNDGTYDSEGTNDVFLDFTGRSGGGDVMYEQPYIYTVNDDGATCTLSAFDGSYVEDPEGDEPPVSQYVDKYRKTRTIPKTRGVYTVTHIGQELFLNNKDMENLVIPETVKEIGIAAFAGCTNLKTITLSGGLKKICNFAFAPWNGSNNNIGAETQSNSVTDLEIPATVEEIGEYAFPYMYEIENITFAGCDDDSSCLHRIGKYAFYKAGDHYKEQSYSGSFDEVRNPLILNMHPEKSTGYDVATQENDGRPNSLPDTYSEIGDFAFFGNQWIGSIRIASDTLVIDGFVFANCFWIVEADLGEGVKIMGNGKALGDNRDGRGRTFSVSVNENSINTNNSITDLGAPLEDNTSINKKPLVPMSSLYLPCLAGKQYVGQGTLDGRLHTMVYTSGTADDNSRYYFQWKRYDNSADIQPAYVDRGNLSTTNSTNASGETLTNVFSPGDEKPDKGFKFSNDQSRNTSYSGYYGIDLAYGSRYVENTYTDQNYYYQLKQGGYFNVAYAHATVDPVVTTTIDEETEEPISNISSYTTTYKDGSGNVIASASDVDDQKRYGFTVYDETTGRAKFDFIQKAAGSKDLILAKFHYNPYWAQSRNVVVPETVRFAGEDYTVKEIGNCAFFRNICPESHAWTYNSTSCTYISPQSDNATANTNQDSAGNKYHTVNKDYYNLESIVLPDTITRIGGNAFYMCAALQSIKTAGNNTEGQFPSGLQAIQQYAFAFTGLTTVKLPSTITTLGNPYGLCNPFTGCLVLTTITITAGGSFKSSNNYITNSDGTKIVLSPIGTTSQSVTIPGDVTTLGALAFRGARSVKTVTIPSTLTTIESGCFDPIEYGDVLRDGKLLEKTHKGIYNNVGSALESITVTGGTSKLSSIGDLAFYSCKKFAGITFENELVSIGNRAFYGCEVANKYFFPNTLSSIGKEAFYNNKKFDTIKTTGKPLGEEKGYMNLAATKLSLLGRNAFNVGSSVWTTLSLPKTLKQLNEGVIFKEGYTGLTTVYMHDDTTQMNSGLFKNNSNLATFTTWSGDVDGNGQIPDGSILDYNALPSGLTKIGASCFQGCTSLPGFGSFPSTLTYIGGADKTGAFQGCTNSAFTSVNLGNTTGNLEIKDSAFRDCTNLSSLILVDTSANNAMTKAGGTVTIEQNAFYGCSSLHSVMLPSGSTVNEKSFDGSGVTEFFICDTYANAKSKMGKAMRPTSAHHYYYAEDGSDKDTDVSIEYWHYDNNVPTPWTPQ